MSLPSRQVAEQTIHLAIAQRERAEERLRQSNARIESILNSVSDLHILFDRNWRYLYVNNAAVRAIGRSREEILGCTLWELFPDLIGTELDRQYHRGMNEQVAEAFEFFYPSLNSWWETRCSPVPDGLAVFATDITDRKRVEEQLRQSEGRFRQLAENITEALWITDLDQHQVLYVSPGYEKIWGRSCESVYRNATAWVDAIHPDDQDRIKTVAMSPRILAGYDEEFRIIRPDGSVRWIRDRAFPVSNEAGRVYRVTGIAEDITDRKSADEAILRLAAIAEQSSDAIIGKSLAGIVTSWNKGAERIYGYTAKEIIGQPISLLIPPANQDELPQILEAIGRGEQIEHFGSTRIRKDGQQIHVSICVSPIRDTTGQVVAASTIARDVTERQQSEEQLKVTTEQLRALSARLRSAREEEGARIAREIHDELGAALSSLRWDMEDVHEALSETGEASQLQDLRPKIEAMMRLTDTTVKTVRRIASELRPVALDTLGLIEAIEWQVEQFHERTGIVVELDCCLENVSLSPEESTAAFRIFQEALTNILRHAQATSVNLQMKVEDGEFTLTIRDNGRGITNGQKAGTQTLGLLGMRERASLIGGKIEITGTAGSGAMVALRIPISNQSISAAHHNVATLRTRKAP